MASGPISQYHNHDMSVTNGHTDPLAMPALTGHTSTMGDESPLSEPGNVPTSLPAMNGTSPQPQPEQEQWSRDVESSGADEEEDAAGEDDEDYDDTQYDQAVQIGKRQSISSESSTKSTKRKRDDAFMIQDPELYGLRRSGRAKPARQLTESSDEEDDDVVHNGRKRQKTGRSTARKLQSSAQDTDASGSDDDVYDGGRPRQRLSSKKHRRQPKSGSGTPQLGEVRFSTRRSAKITTYNEDEADDFDEEMDNDAGQEYYYVEEDTSSAIDIVLNHRLKEDAAADVEDKSLYEYLIKWQGQAQYHATWEEWETLSDCKGQRRVVNYYNKFIPAEIYYMTDTDVPIEEKERYMLDREAKNDMVAEWQKVERIIDRRNGIDGVEYYVKWKALPYDSCTWESESLVSTLSQEELDRYLDRASRMPNSLKKESVLATRSGFSRLKEQPPYIKHGTLREFQLFGLNFLIHQWCTGNNAILADEMGLGKTVQTVAFINWLIHERRQEGPFLVVVPLSTMPAWAETFNLWSPDVNFVVYNGKEPARRIIQDHELFINGDPRKIKFNVLLTTYEFVNTDKNILSQVKWQFMAVDEAHRLKNRNSLLYANLVNFAAPSRLLITGTPMQNTLSELSALMDFIAPGKIHVDADLDLTSEDATQKLAELTQAIKPYMMRRTKAKVESDLPPKTEKIIRIELSDLQLEYYKNILARNYAALNSNGSGQHKMSLLNLVMELKKTSNHAFMFPNAEERVLGTGKPTHDEQLKAIIANSGKMIVLDRLLSKLKQEGHRVLIFSQMVGMLNILSDYMVLRNYQYQRLDGTVSSAQRKQGIDHFNAPDSQDFVFLLSTRAGGLGINLMTADTVILFDSDWNPQADLQAMARAHRIGQKKPVSVYRFVAKETIEEEILERARNKLMLEFITIQRGVTDQDDAKKLNDQFAKVGASIAEPTSADDISRILAKRGQKMFEQTGNQKKLEELDIDDVLANAELHQTEQPEGMTNDGGEEFLRNFEYTDVKLDLDWEKIIPKEQLDKIKAEEAVKANQEYLDSVIEQNAPRKRKAATDDREQRAASKRARVLAAEAVEDASEDEEVIFGDPARPLNTQETRNLVNAYQRYGSMEQSATNIMRDAKLVGRDAAVVTATLQRLLDEAKRLLDEDQQRQAEIVRLNSRPVTKKEKKAVLFDWRGIKRLNAETLLERPADLVMIKKEIDAAKAGNGWASYRVTDAIKAPSYSCAWGAREDGMLIVGIARHGYGAWKEIRDDPGLGLRDKLFLNEQTTEAVKARKEANETGEVEDKNAKSPGPVHLVRRVAYLISVLRNKTSGGSDESVKRALDNHHRNNKKSTAARLSTPQNGSASPAIKNGDKRSDAKNGDKRPDAKDGERRGAANGISKATNLQDASKSFKARMTQQRANARSPGPDEVTWDRRHFDKLLAPVSKELSTLKAANKKLYPSKMDLLGVMRASLKVIGNFLKKCIAADARLSELDLWRHVAYFHTSQKKDTNLDQVVATLRNSYAASLKDTKATALKTEVKHKSSTPPEHPRHAQLREESTSHSLKSDLAQNDRAGSVVSNAERKPSITQDRLAGMKFEKKRPGDRTNRDNAYVDERRQAKRQGQRRSPPSDNNRDEPRDQRGTNSGSFRERSRSPFRRPENNGQRERSRSPIRRPENKSYRERSRSPVRQSMRERSRSPVRQPTRERSRSPVRRPENKSYRERSRSPVRRPEGKSYRERSRSPVRQSMRERSRSLVRQPTRERSRSPVRRPQNNSFQERSRSPVRRSEGNSYRNRSRSPIRRPETNSYRSRSPAPRRSEHSSYRDDRRDYGRDSYRPPSRGSAARNPADSDAPGRGQAARKRADSDARPDSRGSSDDRRYGPSYDKRRDDEGPMQKRYRPLSRNDDDDRKPRSRASSTGSNRSFHGHDRRPVDSYRPRD